VSYKATECARADLLLTMRFPERHARACAITCDTLSPANRTRLVHLPLLAADCACWAP
jgi:hypothetical protein